MPKYNIVVSRKKLKVKNNRFPYAVCKLHREQRRRGEEEREQRSRRKIRHKEERHMNMRKGSKKKNLKK